LLIFYSLNGEANLEIRLFQHEGQWQILGFHVNDEPKEANQAMQRTPFGRR
jgi:hypothetical protein